MIGADRHSKLVPPVSWPAMIGAIVLSCLLVPGEASGQSAEEFLRQAARLVQDHQLGQAETVLRQGLSAFPDHSSLLLQLGALLVHTGRLEEGDRLLQRALRLDPHNPEVLRSMAEARLRQGQFGEAIGLLQSVLWHTSDDAEAHARLSYTLFLEGRDEEALKHAERAVQLHPLNPDFRSFYALLLESRGKREESYRQLRMAQQLAPKDAHLLFRLASREISAGRFHRALEYLEMAVELDAENPLYHDRLAVVYRALGQSRMAQREDRVAAELRRAFESYVRALQWAARGDRARAVEELEPVVRERPEFLTGRFFLADLYQQSGQRDKALELYLQILDRDPTQALARERSAWIEVQRGALDLALKLLQEIPGESPNRTLVEGYRALLKSQWQAALMHFREVERLYPLEPSLLQLMAFCLEQVGDYAEARSYLLKAGHLDPRQPQIGEQIRRLEAAQAFELIRSKRWAEALNRFLELLRSNPDSAEYAFNAAYCHQQLGDLEHAARYYRMGLESAPDTTWARINLASVLYLMGEFDPAARLWEQVVAVQPSSEAFEQLGLCYSQLRRFAEAEQMFQKALQTGSENPRLLYNLAMAKLHQKKSREAWPLVRKSASAGYEPARRLLAQLPSETLAGLP